MTRACNLTKPVRVPPAGGTYPIDEQAEAQFLRALEEPGAVGAGVVGEPSAGRLSGVGAATTSS